MMLSGNGALICSLIGQPFSVRSHPLTLFCCVDVVGVVGVVFFGVGVDIVVYGVVGDIVVVYPRSWSRGCWAASQSWAWHCSRWRNALTRNAPTSVPPPWTGPRRTSCSATYKNTHIRMHIRMHLHTHEDTHTHTCTRTRTQTDRHTDRQTLKNISVRRHTTIYIPTQTLKSPLCSHTFQCLFCKVVPTEFQKHSYVS